MMQMGSINKYSTREAKNKTNVLKPFWDTRKLKDYDRDEEQANGW